MAYFPSTQTVYEGTLPAHKQDRRSGKQDKLPTVTQIQTQLNKLAAHLGISGAAPTDVAGQPTYTVTLSPKPATGLLSSVQLAWDALKGVPLRFAVYARGDSSPVIELAATGITYGPVSPGVCDVAARRRQGGQGRDAFDRWRDARQGPRQAGPPRGGHRRGRRPAPRELHARRAADARGHVPADGPAARLGRQAGRARHLRPGPRRDRRAEQHATAQTAKQLNLSQGSGDHQRGIELPTVQINGATAQQLDTELGTRRFTRGDVTYTVLGSVSPSVADTAARGL